MRKIYLAIIILMLFMTGCSKVDSRLVGKWRSGTGSYATSFSIFSDGTGSYRSYPCSVKITDNLLVFEYEVSKRKISISYSVVTFTDTAMTLNGSYGTKVFTKL